jgi:hypothetical protein
MKESRPWPVRCNNVTVLIAVFTLFFLPFCPMCVLFPSSCPPSSFSQSFIAVYVGTCRRDCLPDSSLLVELVWTSPATIIALS